MQCTCCNLTYGPSKPHAHALDSSVQDGSWTGKHVWCQGGILLLASSLGIECSAVLIWETTLKPSPYIHAQVLVLELYRNRTWNAPHANRFALLASLAYTCAGQQLMQSRGSGT